MALAAAPGHRGALETFIAAHEVLLAEHGENFWLAGWLNHQIADAAPAARIVSTGTDVVTVDEVVSTATAETGLDDLGDPAWREGLDVLLDSVEREADLNDVGRMILRTWIDDRLVNRLRVVDWVRNHPEVRDEEIRRPLVVVGMLRTGSTLLCELLACDPANRPLMKWEGLNAIPPPVTATFRSDPRIAVEVEKQEGDLLDGAAAQGGALGTRRRADRMRRAAHPVVPRAGLARALPHPVVHRVVPRL